MLVRRKLVASIGGAAACSALEAGGAVAATPNLHPMPSLHAIPMSEHERAMRLAIDQARLNPEYPFGAVIARAATNEVVAKGVNNTRANPILHGEIAAINDYVASHGTTGWEALVLYTTGEPCPMCMSALVWAGIGGVVFATSIAGIRRAGFDQIDIGAAAVIAAAPFYHGELLGGVLKSETDQMFLRRKRT